MKVRYQIMLLVAISGTVFLSGCATEPESHSDFTILTGTVDYRQRIAMPPDAVLNVRVEDVSRADVESQILAETKMLLGDRQVPIEFTLQVPTDAIKSKHRYTLRATLTEKGTLRFTTTSHIPVLSEGVTNPFNIIMDAVNTPSPAKTKLANLKDTYWQLKELDGKPIPEAPTKRRQVRATFASEGSRLTGFSGCNHMVGTYTESGNALHFSKLAVTKMACMDPYMDLEQQVLAMLNSTTAYRITGEQLLLLNAQRVLGRFELVSLR